MVGRTKGDRFHVTSEQRVKNFMQVQRSEPARKSVQHCKTLARKNGHSVPSSSDSDGEVEHPKRSGKSVKDCQTLAKQKGQYVPRSPDYGGSDGENVKHPSTSGKKTPYNYPLEGGHALYSGKKTPSTFALGGEFHVSPGVHEEESWSDYEASDSSGWSDDIMHVPVHLKQKGRDLDSHGKVEDKGKSSGSEAVFDAFEMLDDFETNEDVFNEFEMATKFLTKEERKAEIDFVNNGIRDKGPSEKYINSRSGSESGSGSDDD